MYLMEKIQEAANTDGTRKDAKELQVVKENPRLYI